MVASQFVPALGRTWRRHIRWYPGDWIWPVLFGLIVAVLAGTIAILVANNNDKGSQKTIVATTATTTATATTATQPATETTAPATTAPTETTSTAATETTPTTTATTPTQTTPTGPITWPAGKSGWTIVLASVAKSAGLSTARSDARKAIGAGLKDVGILNSDNYSSLKGGYYVVFSGVYDTNGEAESNLSTAKATFSGAYAREITP
jgi:cytoskeletal protein RodZ